MTGFISIEQLHERVVDELRRQRAPAGHSVGPLALTAHGLFMCCVCLFSCATIISEARFSPDTNVVKLPE